MNKSFAFQYFVMKTCQACKLDFPTSPKIVYTFWRLSFLACLELYLCLLLLLCCFKPWILLHLLSFGFCDKADGYRRSAAHFPCMILIDLASYFVMLAIWVGIATEPDSRAAVLLELEMENFRMRLVILFLVKSQFSWSVGVVILDTCFVWLLLDSPCYFKK